MATCCVLPGAVHVLRIRFKRFYVNTTKAEMNLQQSSDTSYYFLISYYCHVMRFETFVLQALLCAFMCFEGGVALESPLIEGWDLMLSKLACYF